MRRLLWAVVGLLVLWVPTWHPVAAASVLVQSLTAQTYSTGTSNNFNFGGNVTTGNAVIVAVARANGTGPITIGASDATNGAYTSTVNRDDTGRQCTILEKRNLTGGFTQVTVTTSASVAGSMSMWEVSGLDSGASPQSGTETGTGVSSFNHSSTGLTATGFLAGVIQFGSPYSRTSLESGYTAFDAANDGMFVRGTNASAAYAGTQGSVTTMAAENITGCLAIYAEAVGGHRNRLLMGVG